MNKDSFSGVISLESKGRSNMTASILKKIRASSLRLYINGNNLITWHGLYPGEDPEQVSRGGDWAPYPNTRVINFGFNIKF